MQESATYQVILKEGIEQGIEQGIETGIETGKFRQKGETAIKMLKKGFAIDDILELTSLTLEQIQQLQAMGE